VIVKQKIKKRSVYHYSCRVPGPFHDSCTACILGVATQRGRPLPSPEEIARLTAENADAVCGDCLDGDADYGAVGDGAVYDDPADDDADRYVCILSWCPDVL
jgi:hypothetical protein